MYYTCNPVQAKGYFEVLVHKNSVLNKLVESRGTDVSLRISGPFGRHKYLGNSEFYE